LVFHSDFPKKEEVDRYWNLTVGFKRIRIKLLNGRLVFLWILDRIGFGFWPSFGYWISYQSTSDTKLRANGSLYNCTFTLF
jgi:hypothetical protein